jgi:hypothetical protein
MADPTGTTNAAKIADIPLEMFKGSPLANYYDYFYSSADAYIYISSVQDQIERNLEDLPFLSISYSVEQPQKPIYGFWDRTARAFVPGRSIVMGSFAIPHTYVDRLEELLKYTNGKPANSSYLLSERDQLKNKYWGTRDWGNVPEDPDRVSFPGSYRKHLFYASPLFDISILYGIGDEISYGDTDTTLSQIMEKKSSWGGPSDVNWTNVPESYKDKLQRETLSGVKITGKVKTISVGGQPIVEEYSFICRQVTPY